MSLNSFFRKERVRTKALLFFFFLSKITITKFPKFEGVHNFLMLSLEVLALGSGKMERRTNNMEWTDCKTKVCQVRQNIKFNQQESFLSRDYGCQVAVICVSRICNV